MTPSNWPGQQAPHGPDYIHNLCGDFFELHGDRCYADDGAIVGASAISGAFL